MLENIRRKLGLIKLREVSGVEMPKEVSLTLTNSFGSSGTKIFSGFFDEEYLQELSGQQGAEVYDKMRRGDSRVKMCLKAVSDPIKSGTWEIDPASDDEEHKKHQDFAKFNLFEASGKPWVERVGEMLSFLPFGYSLYELADTVVLDHPKWGSYNGINFGFRSQKTIYRWILNKDTGEIEQVEQNAYGDLERLTYMPGQNLMVLSLDKEGDNYEGVAAIRACYGPYFRKQVYQKLMAIGIERNAIPTPKVKFPPAYANSPAMSALIENLMALTSHQQNFIVYPNVFEVDFAQNDFSVKEVKEAIQFENEEMSYSFLENFLLLGSGGNSSGSYSLSFDQSDFFLSGVEHTAKIICEAINKFYIPRLIKNNFGAQDAYPKLSVSGISDKAGQEFGILLKNLSDGKYLTPDNRLEASLRKRLGLPEMSTEGQRQIDGAADLVTSGVPGTALGPDGLPIPTEPISNTALNGAQVTALIDVINQVATGQIPRQSAKEIITIAFKVPLAEAERMLGDAGKGFAPTPKAVKSDNMEPAKLSEGEKKNSFFLAEKTPRALIRESKKRLAPYLKEELQSIGDRFVKDLVKAYSNATPSQRLTAYKGIHPVGRTQYVVKVQDWLTEVANLALVQVLKEIPAAKQFEMDEAIKLSGGTWKSWAKRNSKRFEDLPTEVQKRIQSQSELLVDGQLSDLEKGIYFKFTSNAENVLGSSALLEEALQESADDFVDSAVIETGATNAASTIVNESRNAVFFDDEVLDEVESFTFMNGDPISEICQDLAGTTFSKDDTEAERYFPPLHHNCKSYIVANLKGSGKEIDPSGLKPSTKELESQIQF